MSFAQQTSAFFDELSSILDKERKVREEDIDRHSGRPFSSELTQDEEPVDERSPYQVEDTEPEAYVRGGGLA